MHQHPKEKTFGTTAEYAGLTARVLHVGVGQVGVARWRRTGTCCTLASDRYVLYVGVGLVRVARWRRTGTGQRAVVLQSHVSGRVWDLFVGN